MANTPVAIDWAVANGANAIEVDLQFQPKLIFRHGGICDCYCTRGICSILGSTPISACNAESDTKSLLQHIGKRHPLLELLIIDSKFHERAGENTFALFGVQVVRMLEKHLFASGYEGDVVIGAAKLSAVPYLTNAQTEAALTTNQDRYAFTIDGEGRNAAATLEALSKSRIGQSVYGVGISACVPLHFEDELLAAQASRTIGMIYAWTLDWPASFRRARAAGANGIMTNHPRRLRDFLRNSENDVMEPVQKGSMKGAR